MGAPLPIPIAAAIQRGSEGGARGCRRYRLSTQLICLMLTSLLLGRAHLTYYIHLHFDLCGGALRLIGERARRTDLLVR